MCGGALISPIRPTRTTTSRRTRRSRLRPTVIWIGCRACRACVTPRLWRLPGRRLRPRLWWSGTAPAVRPSLTNLGIVPVAYLRRRSGAVERRRHVYEYRRPRQTGTASPVNVRTGRRSTRSVAVRVVVEVSGGQVATPTARDRAMSPKFRSSACPNLRVAKGPSWNSRARDQPHQPLPLFPGHRHHCLPKTASTQVLE